MKQDWSRVGLESEAESELVRLSEHTLRWSFLGYPIYSIRHGCLKLLPAAIMSFAYSTINSELGFLKVKDAKGETEMNKVEPAEAKGAGEVDKVEPAGGGGGGNWGGGGGGGNWGGGGGGGCRHGCCYRGYGGCQRCCTSPEEAKALHVAKEATDMNKVEPAEAKGAGEVDTVEPAGGGGGGNWGGGGGGGNWGGGGGGGCRHGCCYRGYGGCQRCCTSPEEAKAVHEAKGATETNKVEPAEAKGAGEADKVKPAGGGGGGNWGGGGGGNWGGGGGGGCRHGCCNRGYRGCQRCCTSPEEAKAVAEKQLRP